MHGVVPHHATFQCWFQTTIDSAAKSLCSSFLEFLHVLKQVLPGEMHVP